MTNFKTIIREQLLEAAQDYFNLLSKTIGFVDGHYCVWPITLLDKNHLDKDKPIHIIKPKII